jgi:hypothetical protein
MLIAYCCCYLSDFKAGLCRVTPDGWGVPEITAPEARGGGPVISGMLWPHWPIISGTPRPNGVAQCQNRRQTMGMCTGQCLGINHTTYPSGMP